MGPNGALAEDGPMVPWVPWSHGSRGRCSLSQGSGKSTLAKVLIGDSAYEARTSCNMLQL